MLLYAIARYRGAPSFRSLSRAQLGASWLVGSLLVGGRQRRGQRRGAVHPVSLAALVISSVPLWVVLCDASRESGSHGSRSRASAWGSAASRSCCCPAAATDSGKPIGFFLVVLAAFSWASGSFISRRVPLASNALLSTSVQMAGGGLTMLVLGLVLGEAGDVHPGSFSTDSLLAFAYLVFIGSLIAYTAYVWLLQNAPISKVTTYAYVNPVVAIFLGWSILSEKVTATTLIGAAVIISSVAVTVRRESG